MELGGAKRDGTACRMLLVEDNDVVRKATARALRRRGVQVTEASGAREALSKLRTETFDVVATDISMPEMNGVELMKEIHLYDPLVRVILMTGLPSLETAISSLDLGAFRYLNKPFEAASLVTAAQKAAEETRAAREESTRQRAPAAPEDDESDVSRLEARFAEALPLLTVAYQPVLEASTGRVKGFEALLRGGLHDLSTPASLFSAAKRLDREKDLGRFVRKTVSEEAKRLDDQALLFVNMHPLDLLDPTLVDWGGELRPFANRTVFEISDFGAFASVPQLSLRIGSLRKMGFRIALDDVGPSQASIPRSSFLNPDFLKLDVSLVREVDGDDAKRRVVSAITGLARELGVAVIAEAVETVEESETLRDLGCDYLQGFLFARPGPAFPQPTWPHAAAGS